jgi:predicted N-acetyltransferase YhbS
VTLIGRLAVDTRLKGQGVGAYLLMDALHRSLTHAAEIAAMAVVVDAKDDAAAAFYRHFDFKPLQANARRLYLPMKTVEGLFG